VDDSGGGILGEHGSAPTLTNLFISGCRALHGGCAIDPAGKGTIPLLRCSDLFPSGRASAVRNAENP
jgi:hypothetical protein